MPCVAGCGACCDHLYLAGNKRDLLARAVEREEYAAYDPKWEHADPNLREWARRLIPLTPGVPGETHGHRYACPRYDRTTKTCGDYEHRPRVCSDYPFYGDAPDVDRALRLPPGCGYVGESLVSVAIGG